jgi:hypothetical protein
MVVSSKGSSIQASEYAAARERRELQLAEEMTVSKGMGQTKRTSIGLRDALFDEIDALRRGDGDPHRAIAVSKLASTILDTVRVEMQYRKTGLDVGPQTSIVLGDNDTGGK